MASIPEPGKDLTPREADVMNAFRDGCATAKEVARKLNLSHRTVEIYVSNAVVKLEARSQQQAILIWDRRWSSVARAALQQIAGMDPDGKRADDLGRAARIAQASLDVANNPTPPQELSR
jgi:DNA-binding CsgD family transcriptional regulator